MITLLAALLLVDGPQRCQHIDQQRAIQVGLRCDKNIVTESQPLECAVTLESKRGNGILIAPSIFLPFDTPRWPRARLQFEIEGQGGKRTLAVSREARLGRFDVSIFTERSVTLLYGGDVRGFLYDLNGADWVLPADVVKSRVRARLEVNLLQRDSKGRLYPGVSHHLSGRAECAEDLVLHGTWTSDWVEIEVRQASRPSRPK